jgi:hypothetical protein
LTVRALLGIALLAWGASASLAAGAAPSPAAPVIGLMAAAEPQVTASLAAGARLAVAVWERRTGVRLSLSVAEPSPAWSAASGPAVEMAFDERVIALVAPPDRQTAHLLAQLGTRAHLPVVSTAPAPSVTATGSFWVVSVAASDGARPMGSAFRQAYRAAEGREPDAWAALGYDAAAAVAAAVHRAGLDRRRVVEVWRSDFVVEGASGTFGFDDLGRRSWSSTTSAAASTQ